MLVRSGFHDFVERRRGSQENNRKGTASNVKTAMTSSGGDMLFEFAYQKQSGILSMAAAAAKIDKDDRKKLAHRILIGT